MRDDDNPHLGLTITVHRLHMLTDAFMRGSGKKQTLCYLSVCLILHAIMTVLLFYLLTFR